MVQSPVYSEWVQQPRWAAPEWHATIPSTNTEVLADPRPGRVVVAHHQSSGQGRRGRTWTAPPGSSLAISVVVPAPHGADAGWVPLVSGLAVAESLTDSRYAVHARLKWPNDVLVGEDGTLRKVCGVLAHAVPDSPYGPVVVVGAGVNVDQVRAELPVPTATSWRLARGGGAPLPDGAREEFLVAYLDHLARRLADLGAARSAYRSWCDTLGRQITVHQPDGYQRAGRAVEVTDEGLLVVEGRGTRTVHHVGDVVHVRPAG